MIRFRGILYGMRKTLLAIVYFVIAAAVAVFSHGNGIAITMSIGLCLGALLGRYDGDMAVYPFVTMLVVLAFRGVIVTLFTRWSFVRLCLHVIWMGFLILLAVQICRQIFSSRL